MKLDANFWNMVKGRVQSKMSFFGQSAGNVKSVYQKPGTGVFDCHQHLCCIGVACCVVYVDAVVLCHAEEQGRPFLLLLMVGASSHCTWQTHLPLTSTSVTLLASFT